MRLFLNGSFVVSFPSFAMVVDVAALSVVDSSSGDFSATHDSSGDFSATHDSSGDFSATHGVLSLTTCLPKNP